MTQYIPGRWFQIVFIFIPIWGNDQNWLIYFSDGSVQPPIRYYFTPWFAGLFEVFYCKFPLISDTLVIRWPFNRDSVDAFKEILVHSGQQSAGPTGFAWFGFEWFESCNECLGWFPFFCVFFFVGCRFAEIWCCHVFVCLAEKDRWWDDELSNSATWEGIFGEAPQQRPCWKKIH